MARSKKDRSSNERIAGAHIVLYRLLRVGSKNNWVPAVLLCKRTQDASIHPGCWALIGGKRENRKTPEQTVRREIKEELKAEGNLKELEIQPLLSVTVRRKNGMLSIQYFSALLGIGMDKLQLKKNKDKDKVEGEGLGWFTAEETHHLKMRPEDRVAVNKFFQENGV